MPDSTKPHAFNPATIPTPPPTYSQACVTPLLPTSKLITLAGQTGLSPTSNSISPDFHNQVKQTYQNILNALRAANATPRDIVHVRHYIVNSTEYVGVTDQEKLTEGFGKHWIEFMDREAEGHRPPDTVVGVASLATERLLYECEVMAIVHA
jgi:enamine deaminase RidA (YjgF/YER057c/UK114 family)